MQTHLPKIGLFIDADNAPASQINFIMTDIAKNGIVTTKRAYGNWQKPCLSSWTKCLSKHAIQPVQQFDVAKGKNASDIALTIDLVDSLHTDDIDLYVIVSSDSDFTALVTRIRATGKQVNGYGQKVACSEFKQSCNKFTCYSVERLRTSIPKQQTTATRSTGTIPLHQSTDEPTAIIKLAIAATATPDGWSNVSELCKHIARHTPQNIKTNLYSKLGNIIHSIKGIETRFDDNQANMFVRITNNLKF